MPTALITGGTSGIGASFARALAAEGNALVLVARDANRLAAAAEQLRGEFGVEVETIAADLADRDAAAAVAERLADPERPIDTLVNNAGFSVRAPYLDGDPAAHDAAYEVMGRAVWALSAAAGRAMRERGHGAIINVTSLSGLTRQGAYSALKAYATALTEVLAIELHGTGVAVTAVLPGWVRTEFHARGGVGTSAIPAPLWLDADRVVSEALAASRAGRVLCVPTRRYRVLAALLRHLPPAAVRAVSRRLSGHRRPRGGV